MDERERQAFIRAHTRLLAVPHAPEIRLHLADEATELWQRTEDELGAIGLPPPFWAFAWAGGQALARHLLDRPELVRGCHMLDFGSGSGLVGIAAALAGARRVTSCDIDDFALCAIGLNAAANGVVVEAVKADLVGTRDPAWDGVLAGDMCYEQPLSGRIATWLEGLAGDGVTVLLGDPGRSYLPKDRLEPIAQYQVPTTRALEDQEIKRTTVWRFKP